MGHADLSLDELSGLIACDPPLARLILSQEPAGETPVEALALHVLPQIMEAVTVESIADGVIVTTEGATIAVPEDAEIWSHSFTCQRPDLLEEIKAGDTLLVAALKTCEPTDYRAVTLIKTGPFDPPEIPCFPMLERIELEVAEVNESAITGVDGTVVVLTEDTLLMDFSQMPPVELAAEEIEAGDTLICQVVTSCDSEEKEGLMVKRVDPEADSIPIDDLIPPIDDPEEPGEIIRMKEFTIETALDGVITTSDGVSIHVSEETLILGRTEALIDEVDFSELAPGDKIVVTGRVSPADGVVTAYVIFRTASVTAA
jgi:hypothetical protein